MSLVRAMRKVRKEREARDADLLTVGTVLDALSADLDEVHQEERETNHHGDGPAGCSYCIDLRKVKAAHAALARLGSFLGATGLLIEARIDAAPAGREGG